jgi:hypothetical protein
VKIIPELASANQVAMLDEVRLIRVALQSIAESLMRATALPEAPVIPDKPLGPEAIGSYATSIEDMEGPDAEEIREKLRASGLTDHAIESQLVSFLTGEGPEE